MSRKSRRVGAGFLVATLALMMGACSSGGGDGEVQSAPKAQGSAGGPVEVFLNMPAGSPQEGVMNELAAEFEEESGIDLNVTVGPAKFSDDMRVKIASNSIPDVFSTHGWSVMRYSPYLLELDDQPWAQYVNPGLDDMVLDEEGHLYTLPLEYAITGMIVNYDALAAAGVSVQDLETWDGVTEAYGKIKEAGIVPVVSSAKDSNVGDVGNFIASGAFTDAENQQFKDGTFDPELWQRGVANMIQEWADSGYFNPDFVSATQDDMSRQLSDGSAATALGYPFMIATAFEYNPDANIGFIPFPGAEERYLVGGEGVQSYGVAKDSPRAEEALQWLDFLAQPENASRLLTAMNAYPGLTNVTVDLGELQPSYDEYVTPGEYPTKPFFDRVYLPSGMWNAIITTTDGLINGQMDAVEASRQMQEQFDTLIAE